YQLFLASPEMVDFILPELVASLKVQEDASARRETVTLLAQIFTNAPERYIDSKRDVYSGLLERILDTDASVRSAVLAYAIECFENEKLKVARGLDSVCESATFRYLLPDFMKHALKDVDLKIRKAALNACKD